MDAEMMFLTDEDTKYLQNAFPNVDGFCAVDSAAFTLCIMRWAKNYADTHQIAGYRESAALEIGVWKGKYLSTLYHATCDDRVPVVGVDLFTWGPLPSDVVTSFKAIFEDGVDRLVLVEADSKHLSPEKLLSLANVASYRFASVDGEHTADAVVTDLENVQRVLSDVGIISVDDFMYPHASAVTDGVYRFFQSSNTDLVPFAYCANKLFLIGRNYYSEAYAAAATFIDAASWADSVKRQRDAPRWRAEQTVLGTPIITYSLLG